MILRSATRGDITYRTLSSETEWQQVGTYQQQPNSTVETKEVELTWSSVSAAVVIAVRQHWVAFGARGIPFEYGAPGYPSEWWTYEDPLSVRSRTAQSFDMRTTLRQAIARD